MSNRPQRRQQSQPFVIHQQSAISHSGPLPPADEFARYEQALPGAAERILAMAEKRGDDRRENDRKILDDKIKSGRLGQYFAFIIAMASLAVVVVIALFELSFAVAIIPAIIACTSLAAVFISKKN